MKKFLKIMALVLVVILAVSVFVACGGEDGGSTDGGSTDGGNNGGNTGGNNGGSTGGNNGGSTGGNNGGSTGGNTGGNTGGAATGDFIVTFLYVDPDGNPLYLVEDETVCKYDRTVKKGATPKQPTIVDDVKAFEDYVITGWDGDNDGVADDLWRQATNNFTVKSVVREKEMFDVTFLRESGTVYKTVSMKEGSEIDRSTIDLPVELGKYFKNWVIQEGYSSSTTEIVDDCEFKASYGYTDGTIGKVAAGTTIKVDGVKDEAYTTSGAYLPLNTEQQADHRPYRGATTGADDIDAGGGRGVPDVKADTWLIWDGDYIYIFAEVYDTTLVGRSKTFTTMVENAYLNDTVEIWYSFEQKTTMDNNWTRLGVDVVNSAKYAQPRSLGIGSGRSTHYDEQEVYVRHALREDVDISDLDYFGKTAPSYMAEIKMPAYTEGIADMSYEGIDPGTGRLPGADTTSNAPEDYAFTDGTKLVAGDYIRLSLQINDLMFSQNDISGVAGTYFWDCPAGAVGNVYWLFKTDGNGNLLTDANGNYIEATADDINGKFSAVGHTQRDPDFYIMFSLGDTTSPMTNIWGLAGKADERAFYKDKACTEVYTRPVE